MLSEDEKKLILERLEYISEVNKVLAVPKEPSKPASRWAWLNSGLVLLLVTSAVSALIVPSIQSRNQELDWKRHTQSDRMKSRLDSMRQCFDQFTLVSSYTTEALEIGTRLLDADVVTVKDTSALRDRLMTAQLNRVRANAKLLASLTYFRTSHEATDKEKTVLTRDVQAYINSSTRYLDQIRSLASLRLHLQTTKDPEARRQFQKQFDDGQDSLKNFSQPEELFLKVFDQMETLIDKEERYYANLKF